jgi:hypothetical protein
VGGDNHCGYIAFRNPFAGSLIDDGAMNIVVRDWIESLFFYIEVLMVLESHYVEELMLCHFYFFLLLL